MAPFTELQGVQVALPTPFTANQEAIDVQALDTHINRLIEAGVQGLVPGGSTGEFNTLSDAERRQLIEETVRSAAGRVPVIAGIGELSTQRATSLARHAGQVGASALMVLPPFYDAANLDQLREMLAAIHEASGKLPLLYYHIPSATGTNLTPGEIASLADVGVRYMKDTSGDAPALTERLFSAAFTGRVTCFNGYDTLTFYGMAAGAKGSVWGATNVIPELSAELWETLAVRGDLSKARELWAKIFPICKFLESHNYAAAVKTGMELRGWRTGGLRKPFALLEGKAREEYAQLLKDAGIKVVE